VSVTLREVGEFPLIERLKARLPAPSSRVLVPLGDDGGVCRLTGEGEVAVSTVDLLVEGIDFVQALPARLVGRKAMAVNLSDLAAMGARPAGALVAVAAPGTTELSWVESLYDGIAERAREHAVDVLGGDLSGMPEGAPIVLSVTALGGALPEKVVRRAGARPGNLVCVTGTLGDAAAGLDRMRSSGTLAGKTAPDLFDPLVLRQLDPTPRVEAGLGLAGLSTAMIDISDGFLADLGHVCEASGAGASIEAGKLPLSRALQATGPDALSWALSGGEDFELLFTVRPGDEERARAACGAVGMTVVGHMVRERGIRVLQADGRVLDPPKRAGWTHFGPVENL